MRTRTNLIAGQTSAYIAAGTTPATTGVIRIPQGEYIYSRNSGNTANAILIGLGSAAAADDVQVGDESVITGLNIASPTGTVIKINDSGLDVDVRIESANNANHFISDAGLFGGEGAFGFGAVAGTFGYIAVNPPAMTTVASTSYAKLYITNDNATTIPSGTTPFIAAANFDEPNITATGTVSDAYTVRIGGAPTEGTRNGAFWVASGAARFDGNVGIGTPAFGTNATTVLGIKTGTDPTTIPVDVVQIFSSDVSAGQGVLSVFQEYVPYAGVGIASTTKIPVRFNGVTYYILATTVQ